METTLKVETVPIGRVRPHPKNPRLHDQKNLDEIKRSLQQFGQVDPLVVGKRGEVLGGNGRLEAMRQLGWKTVTVARVAHLDDKQELALCIALNKTAESSEWDKDALARAFAEIGSPLQVEEAATGFGRAEVGLLMANQSDDEMVGSGSLSARYIMPPFSILDGRCGEWQERKRAWHDFGIEEEAGLEEMESTVVQQNWMKRGAKRGGSGFDPVLAEVLIHWFCPAGGLVLDPFGGLCTKGIVAGYMGRDYYGVELRKEQVDANRAIAAGMELEKRPIWRVGDSASAPLPKQPADFLFTSPPYYDLEVYSDKGADGSALPSYDAFMKWLAIIMLRFAACLADGRFLAVKLGEIRGEEGAYRNFIPEFILGMVAGGLHYYNEIIFVQPTGSASLRAEKVFGASRKVVKTHQNILVFWKGDPAAAREGWWRV